MIYCRYYRVDFISYQMYSICVWFDLTIFHFLKYIYPSWGVSHHYTSTTLYCLNVYIVQDMRICTHTVTIFLYGLKSLGLNCLQSLMTKFGNCKRVLGNQRLIPLNHNTCHIDKSSGFWFYQLLVHCIRNEDVNNTEYYIFQWQLQCIIPRLEQMLPTV